MLSISLALHMLFLSGGAWDFWQRETPPPTDQPIEINLVTPRSRVDVPPAATPDPGHFRPRKEMARKRPPPAAQPSIDAAGQAAVVAETAETPQETPSADAEKTFLADDTGDPTETDGDAQSKSAAGFGPVFSDPVPARPDAGQYGYADLPPAAELRYDVSASIKQRLTQGRGKIAWRPAGDAYRVDGEAGVLFFNVLEFSSDGAIGRNGILPERYREKRFRKPVTMTHIDRATNSIHFSASSGPAGPVTGSEQDRASVVWQIAALARGNPDAFHAGKQIAMSVAAVRKTETWSLRILGLEELDVGGRTLQAWHVQREPLPRSDDQRIDFWFAPDLEWYPVRIRYSEANGDWLDMSLASLFQPGAPQRASAEIP